MSPIDPYSPTKYAFRRHLVTGLARVWNTLGLDPQTLARHPRLGPELLIGQLASIPASAPAKRDRPLRIAFFTMLGGHSYMTATDITLGRALRARGHDVELMLCDQALPVCENKPAARPERWEAHCHRCAAYGKTMFDASGLPYRRVGELLRVPLAPADARYLEDSDFSDIVESSLFKCFRIGRLRGTQEEDRFRSLFDEACRIVARGFLGK